MTLSTTLTEEDLPSSADRSDSEVVQVSTWNEERAAALLGFQDEAEIQGPQKDGMDSLGLEQGMESAAASPTRLDPRDRPASLSLGSSPFARLGLVGTASLACFVLVGLLISSMAGVGERKTKEAVPSANAETALPPQTPDLTQLEKQKADLLTEAALSKQEAQLAIISDSKNKSDQVTEANPSKSGKNSKAEMPTVKLPPSPTVTAPPAYQTVAPTPPSIWNRLPVSVPPSVAPSTSVTTTPIDPMQQWMTASTIGSYSLTVPSAPSESAKEASSQPSSVRESISVPRMEPVMAITPATHASSEMGQSNSEEAAILKGPMARYLVIGSEASAILTTPIVGEEKSSQNTTGPMPPTRFSVRLEQPLVTNGGSPALPIGTDLIAEVVAIGSTGLVHLQVLSAVVNGVEYRLPPNALSVRGQDGKPLIAQKLQDKGQEIAGLDGALVLFGGLAKVGEVINRPQSTSVTTGLGIATTATQNPSPNLAAAVLEGGFNSLSQQVNTRNQQAIQATIARPNLWFIDRGVAVKVFVNQTIQL